MSVDQDTIDQLRDRLCYICRNKRDCPFVGDPYDPSRELGIPYDYIFCHEFVCRDGREEGFVVYGNTDEFIPLEVDNRSEQVQVKSVDRFKKHFYVTDDGHMVVTNGTTWRVSGQRMQEPK